MKHILLFLIISVYISCGHHDKKKEEIIFNFESVSRSLDSTNKKIDKASSILYDSLNKLNGFPLLELQLAVTNWRYYLAYIKNKFRAHCGFKEDVYDEQKEEQIRFSNEFFFGNGEGRSFISKLTEIQQALLSNTTDSVLVAEIQKMTGIHPSRKEDGFMKMYFYNTPPVAAMTIMSKFDNDVRVFENKILQEHLKK